MINIIKTGGVATVTLNRPDKHNAFNDEIIKMLTEAFLDIDQDDTIKVMILAARGKSFSAGGDLAWMRRMASFSHQENVDDAHKLAVMLKTLNCMSKPTIAKIQGSAFGGAIGLISCCDIAVASSNAKFCLSEVKIGLTPATISPYVIAAMGERAARRYFLTAEIFDAEIAQSTDLISEVCEPSELDSIVLRLCHALLANSPQAMKQAKQLIHHVANSPLDDVLIKETSVRIANIRASQEGKEGLTAFLEKRKPSWVTGKPAEGSSAPAEGSD